MNIRWGFFSKSLNKSGDIDLNNGNTCNITAKCKPSINYKYPTKNFSHSPSN